MKNKWLFCLAIVGLHMASCKKDDKNTPSETSTPVTNTTTPVPSAPVYGIAKDSVYDGTPANTVVRLFEYNSAKLLVKIKYKYGTSTTYSLDFDTIYYNGSGQVYRIYAATASQFGGSFYVNITRDLYYNSDNNLATVTTINDSPYKEDTLRFIYTSGKISTIYHMVANSKDTVNSIVYTNNNPSSLVYDGTSVSLTTNLTVINPYYGVPDIQKTNFIDFITYNNLISTTSYPTSNANPNLTHEDRTYTYSNGRVATCIDNIAVKTTVITYKVL